MPEYLTPGVYYEPTDATRGGISAVRTDIAAFVGLAERGPLHTAWPVESWRQFQSVFGDFSGNAYLAYCVKAFFENGGRRCYIVRVAHGDAARASGELIGMDGLPTLRIRASSEGRWGNRLQVRLANGRSEATQTRGAQPADGSASAVASVVGFPVGSLVRLFQRNLSGDIEAYRVVQRVEPVGGYLVWDSPLDVLPVVLAGFDLAAPIDLETVTFSLSVYENGRLRELYADLSIVPQGERYAPAVISPPADPLQRRRQPLPLIEVEDLHAGVLPPVWQDWLPDVDAATPDFAAGTLTLRCGTDGLANLQAVDFTGDPGASASGLRVLELEEEVSLVAIPDILIRPAAPIVYDPLPQPEPDPCLDCPPPPGVLPLPPGPCPDIAEQPPVFSRSQVLWVQQQLVLHCETQADRVALIDPPEPGQAQVFDPSQVMGWRQQFDSSYAALYYPWVLASDPLRLGGQVVRAIPPSGHAAGVIARTDRSVGAHKAPANAVLEWAQGFSLEVSEEWQALLNPLGINCLRALPGRGLRIYGARTLSSDPAYRYLNVRRLLLLIRRALYISLQWAVFEPHDFYLRQALLLAISSFLAALRRKGALAGATPDQAFFVRCDEENNPPADVALGRLVVDIGVAPVHPAEFVVLRIGRTEDELEITELNGAAG